MVEHRVFDGEEAKPAIGQILRDGQAEPPEGRNVVWRADEQRPGHHLRMDRRSAEVGAVALFQGRHQLGEVQSLVDPDQPVAGIDEIPQLPGGELE